MGLGSKYVGATSTVSVPWQGSNAPHTTIAWSHARIGSCCSPEQHRLAPPHSFSEDPWCCCCRCGPPAPCTQACAASSGQSGSRVCSSVPHDSRHTCSCGPPPGSAPWGQTVGSRHLAHSPPGPHHIAQLYLPLSPPCPALLPAVLSRQMAKALGFGFGKGDVARDSREGPPQVSRTQTNTTI